jgi:hypothetical protein
MTRLTATDSRRVPDGRVVVHIVNDLRANVQEAVPLVDVLGKRLLVGGVAEAVAGKGVLSQMVAKRGGLFVPTDNWQFNSTPAPAQLRYYGHTKLANFAPNLGPQLVSAHGLGGSFRPRGKAAKDTKLGTFALCRARGYEAKTGCWFSGSTCEL